MHSLRHSQQRQGAYVRAREQAAGHSQRFSDSTPRKRPSRLTESQECSP